ncbi:hypothetical protein BDV96DRAFT_351936 [Lophiotrema nucula]|uniref:Zn(2)-C6 fungal-type domain-containing protein n=1 Tax=Lophiotrema nucula TaxID=690887 RepID=A0A6A5ZL46_9PLEO|nr:hypothetical protein BDV96DRAFT_351936 [Lophiotrema nucula]
MDDTGFLHGGSHSHVERIMGPKRAPDSDIQHGHKLPKIENGLEGTPLSQRSANSDFSGSVKKKLAASTRTGQACDRCKIRKIRCDGRPEGCSPCAQNRTPCKTTDRITGRATTRGHTEATEVENNYLRAQIAELQAQVKEMGAEPRTVSGYNGFNTQWPSSAGLGSESGWSDAAQRRTSTSPLPPYGGGANGVTLPHFKQGSVGDNYLGVSSADSLLSHIKGTSLSVFGSEIDITDFVENDEEYERSVMSYSHFLRVALNDDPQIEHVPFPDLKMLVDYATWYFRSLNPYSMLLDKPTFMELIYRIGQDPNFTPSPAETVCVHMMLATIKYQISVRNGNAEMMEESHKHYRYSLGFFKHLLDSHKWQDVQGLTLICLHTRNFPKPGAAWIMCSATFLIAIELGLHRSTKAWADTAPKLEQLEVEMRKRIFWALHALTTNISGKLGRPMPINMEDIDVEFPEALDDTLPGEGNGMSSFAKCSFQVGIVTAKYTVWSAQLYQLIYGVRQPTGNYVDNLRRLENGIKQWREEIPPELADPSRASQDNYIFALYLEHWDQEYQLLLHHPAVCRSTDPDIINSNMDKCLEAAQKMLQNCHRIHKLKSLDIPWINCVVYIAAIFTTLFISFQRKDEMTSASMEKLKTDMSQWTEILGVCGHLLGSGDKLKMAVQKIVEHSLNSIHESIVKRAASDLARAALQAPQEQQSSAPGYANGTNYHQQYAETANAQAETTIASSSSAPYPPVQSTPVYPYNSNSSTSLASHQPASHGYDQQPYASTEDPGMTASHAAALAAAASGTPQRTSQDYTYANSQAAVSNGHQPAYSMNGVSDWRQWTRTFMHQPGAPQGEYLNTANTLLAMGGRDGSSQGTIQEPTGGVDASAMQGPGPSQFQWPGIVFGMGPNGHVSQQ